MGLPHEGSIECCRCGLFNLTEAVIINGDAYCFSCFSTSGDAQVRFQEMLFEEKQDKIFNNALDRISKHKKSKRRK